VVGVVVVPPVAGGVTVVLGVVVVSVVSVSVLSVLVLSPRLLGVVGTPRSVGDVLDESLPPALTITTIRSSRTTAAAPAATRRRRI
jgi:hypothetical protein